jgi:hypothetical protein
MANKSLATSRSAVSQLERSRRQVILMRIIERQQGKGKNPTFEKLAMMMREDPWVAARWPDYTPQTCSYDYYQLMDLVKDDIKTLAMPYFVRQMEIIDGAVDTLAEFVNDDRLPTDTRIKAANSLGGYADRYMKIFGNTAPNESRIQKVTLTGGLDDWKKITEAAEKELSSADAIDGEWEETNSDNQEQE